MASKKKKSVIFLPTIINWRSCLGVCVQVTKDFKWASPPAPTTNSSIIFSLFVVSCWYLSLFLWRRKISVYVWCPGGVRGFLLRACPSKPRFKILSSLWGEILDPCMNLVKFSCSQWPLLAPVGATFERPVSPSCHSNDQVFCSCWSCACFPQPCGSSWLFWIYADRKWQGAVSWHFPCQAACVIS